MSPQIIHSVMLHFHLYNLAMEDLMQATGWLGMYSGGVTDTTEPPRGVCWGHVGS